MSKHQHKKGKTLINEELNSIISNQGSARQINRMKRNVDELKKILRAWNISKGWTHDISKDITLLKQYLAAQNQYYEQDQFNQSFTLLENFDVNLAYIEDIKLLFKSFKIFPRAIWPIRFNSKFVSKIQSYNNPDEVYFIMSKIEQLASGGMGKQMRPIITKTIPLNRFFSVRILRERNLFIHIGVQKIPIIKTGIIKRYQFVQVMHFLDILGDQFVQNKNKCDERMNFFTGIIYNDAAKKDHSEELEIDKEKFVMNKNNSKKYLFKQIFNEYTDRFQYYDTNLEETYTTYHPIPFKPYYVSANENTTVVYDQATKRWLSKDHLTIMERRKVMEYQKLVSDSMVKRFVDFQSAKSLVELLTKIPNFKVNLTDQQKDVIGQNGNVLAIGRSGTGKTTCAVLRLFSIEMLFKIRLSLYKRKYQDTLKGVRCGSQDLDSAVGLHCIFLTASPVLTHEIQRYYKKLTDNIKLELEKKKKKVEAEQKHKEEEEKKKRQEEEGEEQKEKQEESFEQLNITEQQIKQPSYDQPAKVQQAIQAPSSLQPKKSQEQIEQQREMNQQFEGLQLKQDVNNEQFKQDEEDIDELKNKFEESIKKFHSLFDLNQSDYPGFFTVKSYIMMIDGVLTRPFFIRAKNTIIGEDSKASWHNERKGVMMIENYFKEEEHAPVEMQEIQEEFNYSDEEELEHEYLRQIQLRQNKQKQQLTKKLQKNKTKSILSFQVDYDYFVVHFWPRVIKKYYSSRSITPHLVWTQIYSTIKGSAQAHHYPFQYLTQSAYVSTTANTFLTKQQKLDIYQTFCQYERWKIRSGGYDIMDAVNYILNVIRYRGYEGPEIHYIMIDEVQDLPHAIVYLLSKTATYGVFYSGDTAQTIAKGVGFRFCDLKSLFNGTLHNHALTLKAPIMKHLTINFRSHNNILQLANSVVSSIEILFPKTIDRMKKEISDLHGPKPMILSSSDEQLLFYVLCGGEQKKTQGEENSMKKPPLEFGCDQVIIVRDQQSKAKVPTMLQHALCLTIYEAKGLEFNDVILFNFFEESPCPEKWHLLKNLYVVTVQIPKDQYESNLSRHNPKENKKEGEVKPEDIKEEQVEEEVYAQEIFNRKTNTYTVKKLVNNNTKNFKDINDYAELCSQLKLLYTAITRPKKTLIIYDDGEAAARASIQRIWQRLDVIQIITKELVLDSYNKKSTQGISQQVKIFKTIVTATDKTQWKQQGLKMYARGYFDQAMKCFDRSGNSELYQKAEANKYADEATKKLIEIQSERNTIKQGAAIYKEMNKSQLMRYKKKLKSQENESLKKFLVAGRIFQDLHMFKQAGQCFFSGKSFQRAFENFCKAFMHRQAAESLQMQNKYREAAEYYQKDDNYLKAIECLDMVNEWVQILQKIHKFATKMNDYQKQALLKKYSALALQELVYDIEFQNQEQSSKPVHNRVQVIQQKQSEQQDEQNQSDEQDEDDDPQLAAERQYQRKQSQQLSNPSRKQSQVSQQQKQLIDIKESVYEQLGELNQKKSSESNKEKEGDHSMSFSALNNSEQDATLQKQQPIKNEQIDIKSIDQSFGDLNRSQQPIILEGVKSQEKVDLESISSSFSDINVKYQNDLQPDLQSIKSLVDPDDIWVKNSISQINHKLHSEYSVIDDLQEGFNLNVKIIKTKGNIFVQDEIMKKIINIVSIINTSVQQFFKQFKGYQSLITVSNNDPKEIIDNRPQISQFQDIDPKFINIILDTLESFKLFKLCLFVCNRYHLPAKAGRYLISLGMKYSTNCISNNIVNPILLAPSPYRKLQIQKGILASIAIHAIYENVNADFLKIKVSQNDDDNKNTLGSYFIEGLILEGLYKKAVFMVNPQESLKILANYNDFEAFTTIFKQKIMKQNNDGNISFLQQPKSREEISFTKMLLKKAVLEYCVAHKFETVSSRYYKQFQAQGEIDIQKRLSKFIIPHYLPFTRLLINASSDDLISGFKQLIPKGYTILTKGNSLQCLDFISTLLAIVHTDDLQNRLIEQFTNDEFLQLFRCVNFIKISLKKISGRNVLNVIQAVLSMHQCYRISYCKSMTFVNDTFSFVNRTSTIANELVQNPKTNSGNFAYFFEQDYNYILVKTARIIKIVSKKFEEALVRLYKSRIQFSLHEKIYFNEDWVAFEEEMVIKKALSYETQTLGDLKKRKKQENNPSRKKSKQLKNGYDFRCKGRDHIVKLQESSSSEEQEYADKQPKFYRYSSNPRMKYLYHSMHHWFNEQSINSKEVVEGRYLYGAGLNNSYREYTQNEGFNLYDALEFQRFKRIDLFAENILSVYDKLTIFTKHNFLAEILTLLLVQLKALENPNGFAISVQTDSLKYFEKLKFVGLKSSNEKIQSINVKALIQSSNECKFAYINNYVCQMSVKDLTAIACDFLDILQQQQMSQFVNLPSIIVLYVLNIGKNNDINENLRKIIKNTGLTWKRQILNRLIDSKNLADFQNKKKSLLGSPLKEFHGIFHLISVDNNGNLDKAITQSQFDYELQSRIIKGKKNAVSKIAKWWRAKRIQLKQKRGLATNYFEYSFKSINLAQAKRPDILGDIRLIRTIHKGRTLCELQLLIKTQKAKTDLLSFYLTNTVSSSLDFHFILMNLNKIEQCRKHYFQYCEQDIDQLHQLDIDQIHQEMTQILSTIEVWKNDEKWLREKNVNWKRKKVFQVKWMTKNIGGFNNILKKRAGLKKQALLQDKKRYIKRTK